MEFKDYYAALGIARSASAEEVKRAYRKLARRYHPDVSKEPDAEARFKDVAEAHQVLIDAERRAAYDQVAERHARGETFEPPPGWDSGFEFSEPPRRAGRSAEFSDFSDFFESMFGRGGGAGMPGERPAAASHGADHHAKVAIELMDACRGARRTVTLHMPQADAQGHVALRERQLEIQIPRGIRKGQHLRLAGQGGAGPAGTPPGDLYLEIQLLPHPLFRLDGGDISFDLPLAPWEAALGATVAVPTPDGEVQLTVPAASAAGRKLRLKGRGLPGKLAGDLYAVLQIALPAAGTEAQQQAYAGFAQAFAGFNPRTHLEA